MARRTVYILNPAAAAGRALRRWETIRTELRRRGLAGREYLTRQAGDGIEWARDVAAEADLLVAVGGDGTASEVANGLLLAGATAPLAILPLGTGNDLASQLGIRTLDQAIDLLENGQPRMIDTIEVRCSEGGRPTSRHALSFASVGFAGELLRQTTPAIKRWFGPRCAIQSASCARWPRTIRPWSECGPTRPRSAAAGSIFAPGTSSGREGVRCASLPGRAVMTGCSTSV